MIILDTNVVSEPLRPAPDARVMAWLDRQSPDTLYLTTVGLAEPGAGLAMLPAGNPIDFADCALAAIAATRKVAVATPKVRDFRGTGIELLNPWS